MKVEVIMVWRNYRGGIMELVNYIDVGLKFMEIVQLRIGV
jgi:hypothetical protein